MIHTSIDADHELQTALIEEYANEKPPTAGEIYCKIHKYRRELDSYSENRWWARLSKHESRCLTGLFRHTDLKAAFDNLLGIPGLWGGMRISTLNKMISMRCDEVSLLLTGISSLLTVETGSPRLSLPH